LALDSIYVTYWSLRDPLTQSQSLPVLRALAAEGWRLGLVTFEQPKWALAPEKAENARRALAAEGITWAPRRYHKRPPVLATLYDIAVGALHCVRLARRHGSRLFHGRSSVPASVAWLAARLHGGMFLDDADGPLSQEYVDAGVWGSGSLAYRLTHWGEQHFLATADAVAVLTERRRQEVRSAVPREVAVLPCAVDTDHFAPHPREGLRAQLGLEGGGALLVYAGKSGGWYPTEALLDFVKVARDMMGPLRLLVLTNDDPKAFAPAAAARGIDCVVRSATSDEMPRYLSAADAGLSFRRAAPSTTACSPVKNGEYLACGLPIVTTARMGDYSDLVVRRRVGVVVERLDEAAYHEAARGLRDLLGDPELRSRCRQVALEEVSLHDIVVPRYVQLYRALLGSAPSPAMSAQPGTA
jgi:glycosyltransferase involved in cell wall biosynthesis